MLAYFFRLKDVAKYVRKHVFIKTSDIQRFKNVLVEVLCNKIEVRLYLCEVKNFESQD